MKIIKKILQKVGINIERYYPERYAVIMAKKIFLGKEIIACEVGTFEGKHALQMLRKLNIKKLYLIDPYINYEDYSNDRSSKKVDKAREIAHRLLKDYEDKIVWIDKMSNDAINDIKEKLDFIYIDGNHYYPYIDNDIKNYYKLLKDDGIISGHDFCACWKDVIHAVNNFSREINLDILSGYGEDWILLDKSKLDVLGRNSAP